MRRLRIALVFILSVVFSAFAENSETYRPEFSDMQAAQEYCDSAALRNVEGIWCLPDSETKVLIHRISGKSEHLEIIAVETDDASLSPGEIIGKLKPTHLPNRFQCTLYTEHDIMRLGSPKEFIATLSDSGYSLTLEQKHRRIYINPLGLLPHVWKILRIENSSPNTKFRQKGFSKIYPGYDGNGSLPGIPRYL